jgi:hypothetical protein
MRAQNGGVGTTLVIAKNTAINTVDYPTSPDHIRASLKPGYPFCAISSQIFR